MIRHLVLRGPAGLRAAALDRCHVRAELTGVVERDTELELGVAGALPDLGDLIAAGLEVHEVPVPEGAPTGLEADAPILVAPDLLVRPPWVPPLQGFAGIELVVPRGMAFGSGEHASTQAALRAMHAVWDDPASLADVGTGSGILALYAQRRGCPFVVACDVEEAAVRAARELLPGTVVVLGGPGEVPGPVAAVVANLSGAELHEVLADLLRLWDRRSFLILSGMRAGEEAGVRARLPGEPCRREAVGGFVALAYPPAAPSGR